MEDRKRRDHAKAAIDVKKLQEKMKEFEGDKQRKVETTKLLASKINIDATTREEDSKPRTVLFQGREDDLINYVSVSIDNDEVQAAGQDQVNVTSLIIVNDVYAGRYLRLSYAGKYNYALFNITCTHADTIDGLTRRFHGFGLDEEKVNLDGRIHVQGVQNRHVHAQDIFFLPHASCGDSSRKRHGSVHTQETYSLGGSTLNWRHKIRSCHILFLYLPRKEFAGGGTRCCCGYFFPSVILVWVHRS